MDLAPNNTVESKLVVDGANGVGGEKLQQLKKILSGLDICVRNTGKEGEGLLNEGCGADYVQKEKAIPSSFGPDDVGMK